MKVSVLIRSYNEERHIGRLLDGIEKQKLPNDLSIEVIVIDSGSSDSTVSIARHMGATVFNISKEEFSFGRALNIGCKNASGDYFLFASAHVYPIYNDWIEKMVCPFEDKRVALVYGRQMGNELTKFSEHQVFKKWFPEQSNYNQQTPFCNNANCAIRRSLWESQHYDEYLTGLEDLDWAHKIMDKGFKIVYESDAPIVHVHEETPQKIKNRYQREAIALKHILPKVHFSYWDFLRLFTANALSDSYHAAQSGIFFRELKDILIFRYMQFYGTYLGHKLRGEVTKELKSRFYYPNGLSRKRNEDVKLIHESRKIEYT
jgi:rhamnosyltransferase